MLLVVSAVRTNGDVKQTRRFYLENAASSLSR